jgi:N-acetyl-1-D-myo-inositol-2-amino-2-deoxy-alpha-D-glucopyranoside deacetylase
MRWGASGAEPAESIPDDSLCAAPFADVAADIAAVIEATRPTAVVSYDSRGGYGHPDHIRAREAGRRAADVMGVPFFEIDERGELAIDTTAVVERTTAALAAYRSQLTVDGDRFTLSSGPSQPIRTVERFTRVYEDGRSAVVAAVPWREQGFGVRLLAAVLAVIVGVALGGISTVEHQWTATIAGAPVPLGAIVTIAIAAALIVGCRLVFGGRPVAVFAAIGLIGAIGLLSFASAGGGPVVPVGFSDSLLIFGPVVIALVVLLWPNSRTTSHDKLGRTSKPKGTASS